MPSLPMPQAAPGRAVRLGRCIVALTAALLSCIAAAALAAEGPTVPVLEIKGAIGVGTSELIQRTLTRAEAQQAPLVILRLDTPGGLVSATRDIIRSILAARVPVAIYVAPSGARAASAGTYLVYAAHVAAMAPATNLGAATPVQLGAPGLPGGEPERDRSRRPSDEKDNRGGDSDSAAMQRKVMNDAVAFLRSLAQLRGRNAEWAEKAVREAATLTADEALKEGVIDLVALSEEEVLRRIDGRVVRVGDGERRLATAGATLSEVPIDWRTRIITALTEPTVAYFLLILGIYGLIFEFWNPGFVLPGVVGGVCLLLALAALSVLPVDYAGLALIALGLAFMIAEAFTPGIGVLGIGGLIAFIAGSSFLFDPEGSDIDLRVGWPAIAAASVASALFFFVALGLALKARQRAVVTGVEEMTGLVGRVVEWQAGTGAVQAHGEVWQARGPAALRPGDAVRIRRVEGLTLIVEPEARG